MSYADDLGHCSEVQQLTSAVDRLVFYEAVRRLVIITRSLLMTQLQVSERDQRIAGAPCYGRLASIRLPSSVSPSSDGGDIFLIKGLIISWFHEMIKVRKSPAHFLDSVISCVRTPACC